MIIVAVAQANIAFLRHQRAPDYLGVRQRC